MRARRIDVIEQLVEQIESRFEEVSRLISDPEVIGDRQRYAEARREFSELQPVVALAAEWRRAVDDAAGARELLEEGGGEGEDAELREMLASARERIEALEEELRLAMVQRDPQDERNVIIEIQGAPAATRPASGRATCTGCCPSTPSAAASASSR